MNKQSNDKRWFPRIPAECSVVYAVGSSKKWHVGVLIDFAATGIKMKCKEPLLKGISLTVMLKPGQNKIVPEFEAKGKVTRCNSISNGEYEISCKLTEVKPSK